MRCKLIALASLTLALGACGGGKDPLAQLCVDEVAKGLAGQVYRLDEKALAGSKTEAADGSASFSGEIILKPGTSGENKQSVDCTVLPATADAPARVIRFRFNVAGSGLAG
ncbi:MAG TPA: hypothetical protein VN259_17305 [Xanthomonadales bacterium]|nr:hypothetical protein [Xanthomonadales bacterium]